MSIAIRIDESILARDEGTYMHSVIPISGKIFLSNQRFLFFTEGFRKMVFQKSIEIEIEQIDELEEKSNGFAIHIENEVFRFTGTGAQRIFTRLEILYKSFKGEQINLADSDILNEQVFIQGDVQVFLRFGFSSSGHIILSQNRLKIECIPSMTSKVLSPKNINTNINNITSFDYHATKRTLSIFILEDDVESSVSLSGKICSQLFLYLQAIQDGNFTKGEVHDVVLCQGLMGVLSLSVSGYLLLSSKHLLFCCSSMTDNLIGTSAFAIPLRKINQVEVTGWSMEPKIHITTIENDIFVLGSSSPQHLFQSFYAPLCSVKNPAPFRDLRYFPKISQSRANRKLKEIGLRLKDKEEAQLIDWCIHKCNSSKIEVGWILLTSYRLCFIDTQRSVQWEASITDLQNNHPNRQHDPIIRLTASLQKKIFIPQGGSHFTNQMWAIITGIKPEQEGKEGRSGQSIRRVIGRFHVLNFLEDKEEGKLLLSTQNVEIVKQPETLRIMLSPQASSPISVGESFQVEVPCNEGRFRFSSIVREDYVSEPDPIGRYYATFALPKDISVYNQRSAFRVPFSNPTIIEIFTFDAKLERNYAIKREKYLPKDLDENEVLESEELLFGDDEIQNNFTKPEIVQHLATKQSQFYDVSLGGCSLSLLEDLTDLLGVSLKKIFFYVDLPFSNGTIPILARITNSRRSYENPNYIVYGCKFFNIDRTCAAFLKIGVLDLEREQVRSMISIEELSSLD
jgi:hypothetical protein